jgi:hypothetical protein
MNAHARIKKPMAAKTELPLATKIRGLTRARARTTWPGHGKGPGPWAAPAALRAREGVTRNQHRRLDMAARSEMLQADQVYATLSARQLTWARAVSSFCESRGIPYERRIRFSGFLG